jgi:hypothetical protein
MSNRPVNREAKERPRLFIQRQTVENLTERAKFGTNAEKFGKSAQSATDCGEKTNGTNNQCCCS